MAEIKGSQPAQTMTKREELAARNMEALLVNRNWSPGTAEIRIRAYALVAVAAADALIAALNGEDPKPEHPQTELEKLLTDAADEEAH